MATDVQVGAHLFMSAREIGAWRAKGVLPAPGGTLDANREAYIRHLREMAAGRLPSAEKSGLDMERSRLARGQAEQVELKNAVMRREYLPKALIHQAVVGMIEVAKAKLKRVPSKVAGSDQGLKDRIAARISDALIDLSAERALDAAEQDGADDE